MSFEMSAVCCVQYLGRRSAGCRQMPVIWIVDEQRCMESGKFERERGDETRVKRLTGTDAMRWCEEKKARSDGRLSCFGDDSNHVPTCDNTVPLTAYDHVDEEEEG